MSTAPAVSSSIVNGRKHSVLEVVKRNKRRESFNHHKITDAVRRCLLDHEVGMPPEQADNKAKQITSAVLNIITGDKLGPSLDIEHIQRMVIKQLWANNLFEAAEHYTRYRELKKSKRSIHQLSQEQIRLIESDKAHFPTDLQYYQFLGKFARWLEEDNRRETWRETCDRVINWFKKVDKNNVLRPDEWQELDSALYNMESCCAMRVVQMAGPALDRENIGVYNCAALPISDLFSFVELLYILMQGTGCGFSVESDFIDNLPKIKAPKKKYTKEKFVIPDSTEGWCDAFHLGLKKWFAGEDVEFDYSAIRPAGSRLKIKGGVSGGPLPLEGLLVFARNLILNKQGSHLSDIDVHDLCCMAGKIVQVGGVRRASCISLSDLYSHSMRHAKSGNWWEKAKWRSMANNSSVFEERPSAVDFMEEWLALAQSGSGERGLFNRQGVNRSIPKRRKKWKFIVNPCAEIILRAGSKPDGTGGGGQMCNLSLAIARPNDTIDSLRRKIKLATYFGVLQSLCTNFKYIRKEFVHNCNEERLIGVDITGHADCSLLRYGAENRSCLLSLLREDVATTRSELAKRFGINESAADTCVKPSGDSSVLFSCASGISPRFSKYQIRWVRESVNSPMTALLKAEGVPWAVAPEDDSLVVFGFPIKAPEGCTLRNDLTAIQQLENWLDWKENWAEHSVSCTIYVEPHEWLEVGNWVYTHFDAISGISFLPKDNGNYKFSPNEELTEDEYRKMVEAFPKIHWAKLQYYEIGDHTVSTQTPACSGDRCEI